MTMIQGIDIQYLGHSGFRITHDSKIIYIDPFKTNGPKADIILITHDHFDHCDDETILRLVKEGTIIVGPDECKKKVKLTKIIKAGQEITFDSISVKAVPAYNIGKSYHPKFMYVGYVISLEGKNVYHAGDTDRIPEMKTLGNIEIALLPVSGTYTMTAEEAAAAANEDIKPVVAIPMHYGIITGSKADAERFKRLCKGVVVIL